MNAVFQQSRHRLPTSIRRLAILAIGAVKKRPVVVGDAIAIRSMVYLSLSYDHRITDGATGDLFMAFVKKELENSTFGLE